MVFAIFIYIFIVLSILMLCIPGIIEYYSDRSEMSDKAYKARRDFELEEGGNEK